MLFVPPNIPPVPDEITARFGVIIDWLRRSIAALAGRDRSIVPIVVLLYGRLGRTVRRFETLVAKIRAGQLPPPPRDPAKRTPRRMPEAPPDKPPLRLPSGFGWLGQMGGPDVRAFGGQLAHLLTDPEMKAMLDSDPRVGRLMRPLLRMLGVDPVTAGVPPPRGRKSRGKPDTTAAPSQAEAAAEPAAPAENASARSVCPILGAALEASVLRQGWTKPHLKTDCKSPQTHALFVTIS